MNEIRDIHPLVALWLTKNGYSYIHEYKLPDYGRVDFFATHSDGHKMLVEAKPKKYHRIIAQLATYAVQMPDARLAIAMPESAITPNIEKLALKYNMQVILLDVDGIELSEKAEKATFDDSDSATKDDWQQILEWIAIYHDSDVSGRVIHSIFMMGLGSPNPSYKEGLFQIMLDGVKKSGVTLLDLLAFMDKKESE